MNLIEPTKAGRQDNRVVVTGAAGFIASHLVDSLLERGNEVVAIDRRSVYDDIVAATNLAEAVDHPRLRLHIADLVSADVEELVARADVVFHLAAVPGVRSSWGARFADYVNSNIVATQRVLTACENAGVRRLVLASSSSVYGDRGGPNREHDPTGPISPYGATKLAAEHLCLAHARRLDTTLSVAVLRYFTVYGPRQRPGMAMNQVLLGALAGTGVPLYGDGRQRREFTYVGDVVAATLAAAESAVQAAVINVGGGTSVMMRDVVDLASEITGRPVSVVQAVHQAGDVSATEADLAVARRVLGYQPTVDLRDGMARQATWLSGLPDPIRVTLQHESGRSDKLEVIQ